MQNGQQIGPFHIVELIGEGGMARVYRAYQPSLNRDIAIKVLKGDYGTDPKFVERFKREAHSAARLQHPNILIVYDYGFDPQIGRAYLATQLIEGGTLKEKLKKPFSLVETADLLKQMSDALDYAHLCGIIHCDVKPSNILVDARGRYILSDFGIARLLNQTGSNTGGVTGTPTYMSPEQCLSKPLDGRSDLYSMGVMVYEMVTGARPFQGENKLAVMSAHVNQEMPDPRQYEPHLSWEIVAVLKKALAKEPVQRYRTLGEFAQAFEAAIKSEEGPEATTTLQVPDYTLNPQQYVTLATRKTPALVIYLIDVSISMRLKMEGKPRQEVVFEAVKSAVSQMIFRSTRGNNLNPRYRVAMLAYSDEVQDLLGGIKTIDQLAQMDLPELTLGRTTHTAQAFQVVSELLKAELPNLKNCPAPLVCHMTDGVYTGPDPEPVVRQLMNLAVPDGRVLVENIFISDKILTQSIEDITTWPGIFPDTHLVDEYAQKLQRLSSPIPPSYLEMMVEYNYNIKPGALMLFPGNSPELVALGFQMSAATRVG